MPQEINNPEIYKNFSKIKSIIDAALDAADPRQCVRNYLKIENGRLIVGKSIIDLNAYKNIYLVGTGKAVLTMAIAAQEVLGTRITAGCIVAKHEDAEIKNKLSPKIEILLGSHPVPSELSVSSTRRMVQFLEQTTEDDLVICLISGGGSALLTLPHERITLEDLREVTRQLLFCGATINEVNAVRKHLDQIKGGGLAKHIWPARLVTLVLSDVIGDSLDAIASGPTVPDESTFIDVMEIINRYNIADKLPANVMALLRDGVKGIVPETTKPGDEWIKDTETYIIGSLKLAAEAAKKKAQVEGWHTEIRTTALTGEARLIGFDFGRELNEIVNGGQHMEKPACVIAGGETTVTVTGKGKGGRNQETALSAAMAIKGCPDCLFISLATDGEDGPTDAAGAAVDGSIIQNGIELGLNASDYLARNDAYTFLEKTGSLIKIGPTGTNVNDLIFMFAF